MGSKVLFELSYHTCACMPVALNVWTTSCAGPFSCSCLVGTRHESIQLALVAIPQFMSLHDVNLFGLLSVVVTLFFRFSNTGERWLRDYPEASAKMMDLLTGVVIDYMAAQVRLVRICEWVVWSLSVCWSFVILHNILNFRLSQSI